MLPRASSLLSRICGRRTNFFVSSSDIAQVMRKFVELLAVAAQPYRRNVSLVKAGCEQ